MQDSAAALKGSSISGKADPIFFVLLVPKVPEALF